MRVPDQANQILLMQFAHARGLRAYVPGTSQRRVVLQASEAKVREVVKECGALSMLLEMKRLKVLKEFLEEHGLEVPPELESALAMLEVKTVMASVGCHLGEKCQGV